MATEIDHRIKFKSKKIVLDQLKKYREMLKKILDCPSTSSEETKQKLLQQLLRNFDSGVQENIVINGESWEDAPEEDGDEDDCKTLDDMLDENILETTLKRSHYPKKILPYVVRSLKAEREIMVLYDQAIKPQEFKKDLAYGATMSDLLETAPKMIKQAAGVMKSLQALQQKAEGLCEVLSMRPTAESLEIDREVFGQPKGEEMTTQVGENRRERLSLKRTVVEIELSSAYVLNAKRPAIVHKSEDPQ